MLYAAVKWDCAPANVRKRFRAGDSDRGKSRDTHDALPLRSLLAALGFTLLGG